jgi:hypothetical protein
MDAFRVMASAFLMALVLISASCTVISSSDPEWEWPHD